MKKWIVTLLVVMMMFALAGCGKKKATDEIVEYPELVLSSKSLTSECAWYTKISALDAVPSGENVTPALTIEPVEGASCYVIYMVDVSAKNWLHWKAVTVKDLKLKEGAKLDISEYVGPYPPSGMHTYDVIVYALANELEEYPGLINEPLGSLTSMESMLDEYDKEPGNILAKGVLEGTVERNVKVSK